MLNVLFEDIRGVVRPILASGISRLLNVQQLWEIPALMCILCDAGSW